MRLMSQEIEADKITGSGLHFNTKRSFHTWSVCPERKRSTRIRGEAFKSPLVGFCLVTHFKEKEADRKIKEKHQVEGRVFPATLLGYAQPHCSEN